MSKDLVNDKHNLLIMKNKSTGEELDVTKDLQSEQGKTHFTIVDEGAKTEVIRTMGGSLTAMYGAGPVKISFAIPTHSLSADVLHKWMDSFANMNHRQSDVLSIMVGFRQAATGEQIMEIYEGMFSGKPERQYGGSIHMQTWEFVGAKVS